MVVYLDILFFINLIMNYIILIVTSIFGGIYSPRKKIFFSAFIGAVYALCVFFINLGFILKVLVGFLMIFIAFGKKNFFKTCILFFMVSFMFAGAIIAIFYLSKNPSYLLINGIPYIEININLLISAFIFCYLGLCIFHRGLGKNKVISNNITDIYIKIGTKQAKLSTFIDSGNVLFDNITGKPIIVVEATALFEIIPNDLQFILKENPIDSIEFASFIENNLKIRLINFTSLGNNRGMMTIFTPDEIFDKKDKKIDALVGISIENINLAGCQAIMGG